MNRFRLVIVTIVSLLVASIATISLADVKLPAVLASHMVLQREMPVQVWGWADAGEEVTVTLGEDVAHATADDAGKWSVKLAALKANGKTYSMTVEGKNKILLEDILIGGLVGKGGDRARQRGARAGR